MALLLVAAALAANAVSSDPRFFEKTRSDGVTVVCVRHDQKPTIFTSRVECKEPAAWRRQVLAAANQPIAPRSVANLEQFLTTPQPTPRIVGR